MQTTDEIVVGLAGHVYAAPVGTEAPDDTAGAWGAGWEDLGFTTEDGLRINDSKTLNEIRGWPSPNVLRRWVGQRDLTVNFTLRQFNPENLIRALGGGEVAGAAGTYTYTPPGDDELAEFALGVEWSDGDNVYRFIIPVGVVDEDVEIPINRQDSVNLPISFKATKPAEGSIYSLITNDPAFAPPAP